MNNDQRLSAAITWLRFPLIFFILLLHGYSVVRLEGDAAGSYFKTVYPFALWIGETGVPGFFFISGLLFFLSKKHYRQKLTSRVNTLLVPYLIWNSLLLLCYLIAFFAGHPQAINGKSIASFDAIDYLRLYWDRGTFDDGNFTPILCPFWYIRNLLVMSVLSPLFFYFIKFGRELFLAAVFAWWLTTPHNAFIPQTVLFFCLGGYFAVFGRNVLSLCLRHQRVILPVCLALALGDIITHTCLPTPYNLQLHRMALAINIPALFLLADYCSRKRPMPAFLTNAAFITFALHYPIIVILRKACIHTFADASALTHVLLYFGCILLTLGICLAFCYLLDRHFSRTKRYLSGNR